MATKWDRMITYLEWLLTIKSNEHIITWSCKITWQNKIIIYTLTKCLWLSVLTRWGYTMKSFLQQSYPILSSRGLGFSCSITTTTRPMATKLGKVVTYYKKLQPNKSQNLLNTWSREVTWQIKNILSPLPQYLWLSNLRGWLHKVRSFLP